MAAYSVRIVYWDKNNKIMNENLSVIAEDSLDAIRRAARQSKLHPEDRKRVQIMEVAEK